MEEPREQAANRPGQPPGAAPGRPLERADEAALIEQARRGGEEAFEKLVHAYMRPMYFFALGILGDHEDALDCSQEAFVKAYRAMGRFEPGAPFAPWLYRITRNHCLNFLKKERKGQRISIDELQEQYGLEPRSGSPSPRVLAAKAERDRQLWQAIEGLKPDFREIVLLKHFHEFSYKEIAEALDIPIGTVMSRLFNARAALREVLSRDRFLDSHVGEEGGECEQA